MGLSNDTWTTNRNYSIFSRLWDDAVIPTEIDMPTAWTIVQGQRDEIQELEKHLDLAEEARGNAAIRMTSYQ